MAQNPNNPPLMISSLRGGLDDTSPPLSVAKDACTIAENVEFVRSTLGERRKGCAPIDLPTEFDGFDAVTMLSRHYPTTDEGDVELWAIAQDLDTDAEPDFSLCYRDNTDWTEVDTIDDPDLSLPNGQSPTTQTLHGKLFFAIQSDPDIDRLHVWDGVDYRRAGLAAPAAAPTVTNTGSGAYIGTRYFRTRFIATPNSMTATPVYRRSEPSPVTTFTPSLTGLSARIAEPAAINEGETYWEVEASLDNYVFYRIATKAVGSATYDDSTNYNVGYAAAGVLSADIGDYTLLPSAKFISVDNDRLLFAGSTVDETQGSRVGWTPVGLAPGVGNDERMELDTDPFLDLDGFEGGDVTALSANITGYNYAFKLSHIYKLVRTGNRQQAYEAIPLTKAVGAFPGSLVEAVDQAGQPTLYFLDPATGPRRIGRDGLEWCGRDIQTFWGRVNRNAYVPATGVYYNAKKQIHWWVAVDGSNYPNAKLVLHTSEMRITDEGARRGYATVPVGDRIASALCSVMFSDNVDTSAARNQSFKPLSGGTDDADEFVQMGDSGTDDNGTTYRGRVQTAPFQIAGLMNQSEIMAAALLAEASDDTDSSIYVRAVRDFGIETLTVDTTLEPVSTEAYVIKQLDDLSFAELYVVQLEMGDLDEDEAPMDSWALNGLMLKTAAGESA